ncbi:unnamed protein product [Blepharisma stoltei]|uniref:PH domain-containing protein n=1 Tax=Blepharisma stoltei TaxID=1481888 RepID=A0AAU9JTG8_9CILI|nr:unnamed protein product [Blepharisma stoltei]
MSEAPDTILSSILRKRSSHWPYLKRWHSRVFVLDDNFLSYYHPDNLEKPKQKIPRDMIIMVRASPKDPTEFEVYLEQRKIRLRAEDRLEKVAWISALKPSKKYSELHPPPLKHNSVRLEDFVCSLATKQYSFMKDILVARYMKLLTKGFQLFISGVAHKKSVELNSTQRVREAALLRILENYNVRLKQLVFRKLET